MVAALHPVRSLKRALLTLAALTWMAPAATQAGIDGVQLLPPSPTERDTIQVIVDAYFENSCGRLHDSATATLPDTLFFDLFTSDTSGTGCFDDIEDYRLFAEYAPLPAGHYVLTVTEYRTSRYHPWSLRRLLEFEVAPFTPSRMVRWGYVKALFGN